MPSPRNTAPSPSRNASTSVLNERSIDSLTFEVFSHPIQKSQSPPLPGRGRVGPTLGVGGGAAAPQTWHLLHRCPPLPPRNRAATSPFQGGSLYILVGRYNAMIGNAIRMTSRMRSVTMNGNTPLKIVAKLTSLTTLLMTKTFIPTGG